MRVLDVHASGPDVVRLQRLLNARVVPSPNLAVDGRFGALTRAAVQRFQHSNWLSEDGRAGPCTWCALEKRETFVILHNVVLAPQWTTSTCWHAALTMILGKSIPQIPLPIRTGPAGGLYNDSELTGPRNTAAFAAAFGLKLIHAQTIVPSAIVAALRSYGPLMVNMLWNPAGYGTPAGSNGHMVVIVGARGDGTADGTTIRIYDPLPVNKGSKYSLSYGPFVSRLPTGIYQVLHK
jgi:hypothetical protein